MEPEFLAYIEHLVEDKIPKHVKTILELSGFSNRTAFLNSTDNWIEEIELYIREHADCSYFKLRLDYCHNLKYYVLAPGYRGVLMAIKNKIDEHTYYTPTNLATHDNSTIAQAQNQQDIVIPTTIKHTITQSNIYSNIPEATELLNNVLKFWQTTHGVSGTITYNVKHKMIPVDGDVVPKISATLICPMCKRTIQVYMDEPKKRWILSNFNTHFNKMHRKKQEDTASWPNNDASFVNQHYQPIPNESNPHFVEFLPQESNKRIKCENDEFAEAE